MANNNTTTNDEKLDVVIANKFPASSDGAREVNYVAKDKNGSQKTKGNVQKMNGTTVQKSGNISLDTKDSLEITITDQNNNEKQFEISIKPTDPEKDKPNVAFKRNCDKWKLTNTGNGTTVEVGAGPDGQ